MRLASSEEPGPRSVPSRIPRPASRAAQLPVVVVVTIVVVVLERVE